MLSWLHNSNPQAILLDLGFLKIYWYGFLITLGIIICLLVLLKLSRNKKELSWHLWNLFFYLIIFGIIGGRLYHVLFYNFQYFLENPWQILMVWQGGLAIHGTVIAGLIVIYFYTKKYKLSFGQFSDLFTLVLPLGQAIGRWGNYFNQELFGKPCQASWCLPIKLTNRPQEYLTVEYFHPLFLYESVLNLILFISLLLIYKTKKLTNSVITFCYLVGYSIIRFFMEFLRVDVSQTFFGLKWVQWLCLAIILISVIWLLKIFQKNKVEI